jgi:hypothetical protein
MSTQHQNPRPFGQGGVKVLAADYRYHVPELVVGNPQHHTHLDNVAKKILQRFAHQVFNFRRAQAFAEDCGDITDGPSSEAPDTVKTNARDKIRETE